MATKRISNGEVMITITMDEYKDLLMIKGKYEELKTIYYPKSSLRNADCVEKREMSRSGE